VVNNFGHGHEAEAEAEAQQPAHVGDVAEMKSLSLSLFYFMVARAWGANPGSFDFVYFLIPSLYC
jgi:hypothetical protein